MISYEMREKVVKLSAITINLTNELKRTHKQNNKERIKKQLAQGKNENEIKPRLQKIYNEAKAKFMTTKEDNIYSNEIP